MSEPMIGQIMAFAGNYKPRGWTFCSGELMSIGEHSTLYSIWGTIYGGDGRSSFALPDLRGRSPVGMGNGPGRIPRLIGQMAGIERVTLTTPQIPSHNHAAAGDITGQVVATAMCYTGRDTENTPSNSVTAQQGLGVSDDAKAYSRGTPNATMSEDFIETQHNLDVSVEIGNTGANGDHENMPPWTCLNYIIALEGYYPSRT